ncbi:hypothetical protein CYQ88_01540 [Hydrogenovibrio sp. SC-1]|uniref:uroporphyrinogen-III synthase n=1 Tax=Hydrogenovibrio sp. SC-1 TaxID=2065820 RepID=UPI000C7A832F|nr:uroporphyrinogen-III synthase [Hydrogenovibrio sp. SC-1]PLA75277.1 hypothetical protein CYQ88_01540 [Hydrogenovibrio sp. SC-1]
MTPPNALTLLNTRPSHQALALNDLLQQHGFQVLNCPALSIVSVPLPPSALDEWTQFDKVFFISQNAVNHLIEQWQSLKGRKTFFDVHQAAYAIGQATFKAMRLQHWPVQPMMPGKAFITESLLERPELQDLSAQNCLIIKGEAGREDLASGLRQAGANVTEWVLYKRQPMPLCVEPWQAFEKAKHPVILATSLSSIEALQQALSRLKNGQAWLVLQTLIVFSDRIKTQLQYKGWRGSIYVVAEQSNQGILSAMKQIQQELSA